MKSVITKTWYQVLLIASLTLTARWHLLKFLEWRFAHPMDFYFYSIMLIFSALLLFMILTNHRSLGGMIRFWSVVNVLLDIVAVIAILFLYDDHPENVARFTTTHSLTRIIFRIAVAAILFIGSRKYIVITHKKETGNSV